MTKKKKRKKRSIRTKPSLFPDLRRGNLLRVQQRLREGRKRQLLRLREQGQGDRVSCRKYQVAELSEENNEGEYVIEADIGLVCCGLSGSVRAEVDLRDEQQRKMWVL